MFMKMRCMHTLNHKGDLIEGVFYSKYQVKKEVTIISDYL